MHKFLLSLLRNVWGQSVFVIGKWYSYFAHFLAFENSRVNPYTTAPTNNIANVISRTVPDFWALLTSYIIVSCPSGAVMIIANNQLQQYWVSPYCFSLYMYYRFVFFLLQTHICSNTNCWLRYRLWLLILWYCPLNQPKPQYRCEQINYQIRTVPLQAVRPRIIKSISILKFSGCIIHIYVLVTVSSGANCYQSALTYIKTRNYIFFGSSYVSDMALPDKKSCCFFRQVRLLKNPYSWQMSIYWDLKQSKKW